jgi:hypothetical protein
MTTVPRETLDFLRTLHGDAEGFIEVCTIEGDPDDRDYVFVRRFRKYSRATLYRIAAECITLSQTTTDRAPNGLNVYVSSAIYDRPARPCNGGIPLPSRVVFMDDAPAHGEPAYSMVVQTSQGKRHAYYLLDEAADAATRHELQGRVSIGADKSGKDIEQLVRIPGTVNTKKKHGGQYRVWLEVHSQRRYTVEQLRAHFTTTPRDTGMDAEPASIDWESVYACLADIDTLINPDNNIPWHIHNHPCSQTYRILAGQQQWLKDDRKACDPSRIRWHVAEGLLKFFGFTDTHLAAVLLHYGNFEHLGGDSTKGTREIKRDIATVIGKLRVLHSDVQPRADILLPTQQTPAEPPPEVPRKRKGRRHIIDADQYYEWLTTNFDSTGKVLRTRKECAAVHGVSVPTIDRLEANLRARGLLQRHTSKDRRYSWIEIPGAIKIADPALETATVAAVEVLSEPLRIEDRARADWKHTAPEAAPIPLPRTPDVWMPAEQVTVLPVTGDDYVQERLVSAPRRRAAEREPAEQIVVYEQQLGKIQAKKRKLKRLGVDWQIPAMERAAGETRKKIAALRDQIAQAETPPVLSPPDAGQLVLVLPESTPAAVCSPSQPPGADGPSRFRTGWDALYAFYEAWKADDWEAAAAIVGSHPAVDWSKERRLLAGVQA